MRAKAVFLLLILAALGAATVFPAAGCTREYKVEVEVRPKNAGEVTGEGVYVERQDVAVKAEASEGYEFVRWEEDGNKLSTSKNYPFIVRENRELVAVFKEVDD